MAIENDVHAICFLSNENRHKSLITDLVKMLKAEQAVNVRIVMGGAIPQSDYKFLNGAGVDLILSTRPAYKATIGSGTFPMDNATASLRCSRAASPR